MPDAGGGAYTVADHLLDRLADFGVEHVFGVPGDFTLGLLDHLAVHPRVRWVGTANELGAGYAADGYARMRGLGVVCTTFGVGELSALNAVAGSYAEHVPVLHLVGSPATLVQAAGRPTHHTLGDGDFEHTLRIAREVTVSQASLRSADAVDEIDRVLSEIVASGRPGYLALPTDIAELPVRPATEPLRLGAPTSDPSALSAFTEAARSLLADAPSPVVLADIMVSRAKAEGSLHGLLDAGRLRYASLLWGRRVVDESGPHFVGTYIGAASDPPVRELIETAPCLITAGVFFTDLISGFFSQHLDESRRIDVLPHDAVVAGEVFAGVHMIDALTALTHLVDGSIPAKRPEPTSPPAVGSDTTADDRLTQSALWQAVASWLRTGDLVLADQGTAFYGMGGHRLPQDVVFIGQPLWASIGYTLPALLGAALAAPARRPVLLIGDGAAQLTIQELGTVLRHRIPALVVVVDNDGYTVERAIRGPDAAYNDIAPWRWTELPHALGGRGGRFAAVRADTVATLADALGDAAAHPDRLTLIQAVTDRLDVPPLLDAVARAAATANRPTGRDDEHREAR